MLGTSSTIVWMYLNTAPPGWKVLATGADRVLGISGGSQAYNVNGGNTAGSWTLTGYSSEGAHTHSVSGSTASETNTGSTYKVSYSTGSGVLNTQAHQHAVSFTSGSGGAHTHTHDGTDRMAAAVGKLFQLDTA